VPAERLSMRKIREVLRLKFEVGLANRQIARSCAINHSTVADYLRRAQASGLGCWPLPDLDDTDVSAHLKTDVFEQRRSYRNRQTVPHQPM
jgi:hypothetical protein